VNEAEFIAALRHLPLHPGAQDLRDDAAVIPLRDALLVLTHDMIAEGVHYRAGTDPADIAWKLVAVNLSDLAAKGAAPLGVLIGATLIEGSERFVAGLDEILRAYDVPLLGGDTIASRGPASFGCTAIGRTARAPSRTGAQAGDAIHVTGVIGAAMLDFRAGDGAAYLRPRPRLAEGLALGPHVHAMMDVSDGLLLDAARMAEASGCTAAITLDAVPFAPGIAEADRLEAVRWGDDYELLFTAPAGWMPPVPATRIGTMTPAGPLPLLLDGQAPTERLGYQHG